MKEKLARRIAVVELGDKDQSAIELFWPRFMKHADAALDELREPDENMRMAMAHYYSTSSMLHPPLVEIWQAAIDAAREEKS